MYPASEFVEDFVGADRALKRLALQRVRDIDLWKVATVRVGESVGDARAKLAEADIKHHLLVVDDRQHPQGWVSEAALHGERIRDDDARHGAIVEMDDILRDALADILTAEARYGTVVDDRGAVRGVLSIEVISHFLHDATAEARTGADLVEDPA
jgi:osmoprotectant transport system ATP-binding protein